MCVCVASGTPGTESTTGQGVCVGGGRDGGRGGGVSDLVYIRVFPRVGQDVKAGVNIVEQIYNLDGPLGRGVLAAEDVEAHDATEQDGHIVVALRRHGPLVAQLVGHGRWQNGIEQSRSKDTSHERRGGEQRNGRGKQWKGPVRELSICGHAD